MVFLEFEKPLESLYEQLEKIKEVVEEGVIDVSDNIKELENKIELSLKTSTLIFLGGRKFSFQGIRKDHMPFITLTIYVRDSLNFMEIETSKMIKPLLEELVGSMDRV